MTNFTITHATGVRVLELIKDVTTITVPKFVEIKGNLTADVEAGRAYLTLFNEGRSSSHAVVVEKEADREAIHADVRTLVRVGRSASDEVQETKSYWKAGPAKQGQEKLLARGRQYVAKAQAHQEVFSAYGITPEILAAMAARLDALKARIDAGAHARALHIGARAELPGISKRIVKSIRGIDAIVRREYADDPERLAAWIAASNIPWPKYSTRAAKARAKAAKEGTTGA